MDLETLHQKLKLRHPKASKIKAGTNGTVKGFWFLLDKKKTFTPYYSLIL